MSDDAKIIPGRMMNKEPYTWVRYKCPECGNTLEMPEGSYPVEVTALDPRSGKMNTWTQTRPFCVFSCQCEMEAME